MFENTWISDSTIGAITAIVIFVACSLVFVSRLAERSSAEFWCGVVVLLTAVPLVYLLFRAPGLNRASIFYVQVGLMLAYIIVEFVLDYWLRIEFRNTRWAVISYVTLFFAGTGGMIGVASLAGSAWTVTAIILFLIMTALVFYQHIVTGM